MRWKKAAKHCERVFGTYVNREEEYFICPECNEPIYECDWDDFSTCPICKFDWCEEEE